jgi:hypothetical protein
MTCDTINATQNRTQWRGLIYKAVENRKLQNKNDKTKTTRG